MQSNEARVIETLFHILDKEGKMVPFMLNESQREYDAVKTTRDLIPKARQKGFSALGVAYQLVKCLGVPGTRAVLISHEAGATQRLLDRAQFYLKHMKGPEPVLGRNSRNELYFPKTESTYYIGTAGARAFGRGDTITDLHVSEYAWWESAGIRHVAGLMQAVPMSGSVRFESTGNGMANDFYYMCTHAEELGYNVFFRSWHDDLEYTRPLPKGGFIPEGFEKYFYEMQSLYKLTDEQMYWYWLKLLEFRKDLRTMQQEYPSCLEECFQATGGAVFHNIPFQETQSWDVHEIEGQRVERLSGHPKKDHTYVLGADPSGGTGNDEAGLQVLCLDTLEQVLEFGSNAVDPVDFGYFIAHLGKLFNEAFVICEANNHGIATHSILKKEYPRLKLYKEFLTTGAKVKYGFITNENSKHTLIGKIKEVTELGLIIYGKRTKQELMAFHEDPDTGKMGSDSDNKVIALGMSCVGIMKYMHYKKDLTPPPPKRTYVPGSGMNVTFEEIFKNLDTRRLSQVDKYGYPRMLN